MNEHQSPKYSYELREIVAKIPTNISQFLIGGIAALLLIALALSYFIQSPDLLVAEVTILPSNPSVKLVSKINGELMFYKPLKPSDTVEHAQILFYLKNPANPDDVLSLKSLLSDFNIEWATNDTFINALSKPMRLGEIQSSLSEFISKCYNYKIRIEHKVKSKEEAYLQQQLLNQEELINEKNKILQHKIELQKMRNQDFRNDSILCRKGAISKSEYSKSLRALTESGLEKNSINADIYRDMVYLNSLRKELDVLQIRSEEELLSIKIGMVNACQTMTSYIADWEDKYLIRSPIKGTVEYMEYLSNSQFVTMGNPLVSILPVDNDYTAFAKVQASGAGKIRPGQPVNIKLSAYPYQEFGIIQAKVNALASVPKENYYLIYMDLNQNIMTDQGIPLTFGKEMSGEAEIITNKRSLLSRVVDKILHSLDRKPNLENDKEKSEKSPNGHADI